jgi:hypothetical protein
VSTVGQQLADKHEFIVEIHDHLEQVQQHYNSFYDKKHRDVEFVGRDCWKSHRYGTHSQLTESRKILVQQLLLL